MGKPWDANPLERRSRDGRRAASDSAVVRDERARDGFRDASSCRGPRVASAAVGSPPPAGPSRGPFGRIAVLYVAAGLPYALVNEALPGILRREGVDKATITALVADLGLPWTLK